MKYIAKSTISLSVALPNGGYARVSFSPLSDGRSVYYTDDKDIIWALEHHCKYGTLFFAEKMETPAPSVMKKPAKKAAKRAGKKPAGGGTATETGEIAPFRSDTGTPAEPEEDFEPEDCQEEDAQEDVRVVDVTDIDDAKDYLAEHFDIVRTKLKTEEIIMETARSCGVEFNFA